MRPRPSGPYFDVSAALTLHPLTKGDAATPVDHTIDPIYRSAAEAQRARVLSAFEQHGPTDRPLRTAVVGPRFFRDLPLEELLKRGEVAALDLNEAAMRHTKMELNPELQDRLNLHVVDASLFASTLLEGIVQTTSAHKELGESFYQDMCTVIAQEAAHVSTRRLPFFDGSIDYWVCNNTFSSMILSAFNLFIGRIVYPTFGERTTESFLLEADRNGVERRAGLLNAMKGLNSAFTQRHIADVARVLSKGGMAFISDWVYDFNGMHSFANFFRIDARKAYPHHPFIDGEQAHLAGRYENGYHRIQIGSIESIMDIQGDGTYEAQARRAGLDVVDRFCYWDIPNFDIVSGQAAISLNEAVVVKRV